MPPRKSATRPKRTFKSAAVAVDSDVADESLPESPTLPVTPKQRKSARTSGKTPVTPTPTQTQRGTKRSVEENSDDNSDGSNPEVPKSPKKRRAILTTPEQIQQAARLRVSSRALAFPSQSVDAKVEEDSSSLSDVPSSDTAGIAEESSDVENKAPTDVFLDDLSPDPPKVKLELEKCGVYSRKLADPLLRDTYPDRPHLPGDKHNVSWKEATSDTEGHDLGMVKLSKVIEMMPNLSTEYIQKLVSVSFDKKTNVVNLSSVNPAELVYKRLSAASPTTPYKHLFLRGETHPVLCFTLLCSDEDYTKSLKSNNGPFASKLLTGTPLSLEYERMVSTLCYAMDDVEFIRTQIVENRWSFGTRPVRNDGQDNSAKGTPRRRSKMTAPTASPATVLTKSNSTDIWRTQIAANDDIPVFDGRFKQITLPKGIRTVPKDFPPFKGEIPFDSFILVAYTTMGYAAAKFKEDTSVAFNALWALVLSAGED